jgi:pimeloyl-ACP methyl ester carboxylesterase
MSRPAIDVTRTIVLLPGLDGTGLLLKDFKAALERFCAVALISYPVDVPLSYDELLPLVRARLPAGDFIVIGESFSGPLALRLAMDATPGLRGIVLGASFARLDLPLKSVLASVAKFVPVHRIPMHVLAFVLLGRWAAPEFRLELAAALSRVSSEVLTARARATLDIDLVKGARRVALPLLYLKASADRLIPSSAAQSIASIAPAMTIQEITAPHFLFQTAPEVCADAIQRFSEAIDRLAPQL